MLNARVGLGNLIVLWSVTYSLSGNFGGKNNFLEIGFGKTDYTLLVPGIHSTGPSSYYYPLLGYRYHKNFLFKCQILALINHKNNELTNTGNGTLLIPGLSFGKTF
ncbi:MAG: hypothetical protein K0S32_3696 [Bacteroidetes bacterium]|nr:hypothetical protein [Bacteroidota bacterium]